ncbi:MAG: carboxypeptidase regulatory-like domain-containing protein [Vicinamibacterales bacterium]
MIRKFLLAGVAAAACVLWLPAAAQAQSAIAGVVKDTSGAVLPGVTVEAASDVLIEKTRSVITDGEGAYRIVDLRPGTYSVSFILPGFQTFKREGLDLPANFTATINADMKVGALEESVTVSGASPVVDVSSNVKSQVINREVLDAVPTAKTIQSLGQLVVGVNLSSPDVGGSRAMQQTYFAVHGVGASGTMVTVDGLITNGTMGDGAVQAYHNEAMIQEAVYQTAGGAAETITGGLNMNLVPKDGGNRFAGGFKFAKSPSSWQGNNLTDDLRALGVTGVDRISNFYEWNAEQGGPIAKDKLWFYGAFRKARYDKPIANTFVTPAGVPFPQGYQTCAANPGTCEQGVSDEKMDNPVLRLTWQVSPRNKFAVFNDRAMRLRGHAMGALTDPTTASVKWNTPTFATGSAKWTSTLTPRLLVEGGISFNRERYDNLYQPGILAERGTAAWYANVRKSDNSLGYLWNASSQQLGNYPDRYNVGAATSYVTGSHNIKVGFQDSFGPYRRYNNANADLYQVYNNLVPLQVTVLNTPLEVGEYLDANLGIYAQDSWKLNKLTLNFGLRYDYVKQHIMGQKAQIGRFANAPAYDDIQFPVWKDWSPRAAAVYDIFGNGKTAIRMGYNKFMTAATTGFSQLYNPTASTTLTMPWTDLNGDDIAQGERGCAFGTSGCEINFATLPNNFGVRSLTRVDPDLRRPYQLAFNAGISHEVVPGVAVTVEYFRSAFRNLIARNNMALSASDYTPVSIYNPMTGGTVTAYNLAASQARAVDYLDANDKDLKRRYDGLEVNFNARLPHGARLFGGTSTERTVSNSCSAAARNPNLLAFCDQNQYDIPFRTSFKLAGTVPVAYGVTFSGSLQALAGSLLGSEALPYGVFTAGTGWDATGNAAGPNGRGSYLLVTPNTNWTAATCKDTTKCTIGQRIIPNMTQAGLTIPLVAAQTEFAPRLTQVDLALARNFTVGSLRINPKLDIFNAFNADAYTSVTSTQFGAATYGRPSVILQGRIIRFGADIRW